MNPRSARIAVGAALVTALAAAACGPTSDADSETGDGSGWDQLQSPEDRLMSVEGLEGPEAVKYDPDQDVWFVSNFGSSDEEGANDGYIARVGAATGAIEERKWATGPESAPLQEPRGMALIRDTLWVADAAGVHAFHRRTGEHLDFVDLTAFEPGFINDLIVAGDGALYVTDTGRSRVYRIAGGAATVALEGPELGSPNGIAWDPGTGVLVLVPWAGGDSIRAWRPGAPDVVTAARTPGGRFDGVEIVDGALVVASQADSTLQVVVGGTGHPFVRLPGPPADIAVDTRRRRVAVPYIGLNRVDVFQLPAGRPGGR